MAKPNEQITYLQPDIQDVRPDIQANRADIQGVRPEYRPDSQAVGPVSALDDDLHVSKQGLNFNRAKIVTFIPNHRP